MEGKKSQTRILLDRWNSGDAEALGALLARNMPWILNKVRQRLGRRLRRKIESVDIVQEAALELFRYGPRFTMDNERHFRALLSKIIENVLRGQNDKYNAICRKIEKEKALPGDTVLALEAPGASVESPSRLAVEKEERAWIQLALRLLGPTDRVVILLRQYDGRSFGEIGQEIGVSEDAARMRFNRALLSLANVLEKLRSGNVGDVELETNHED